MVQWRRKARCLSTIFMFLSFDNYLITRYEKMKRSKCNWSFKFKSHHSRHIHFLNLMLEPTTQHEESQSWFVSAPIAANFSLRCSHVSLKLFTAHVSLMYHPYVSQNYSLRSHVIEYISGLIAAVERSIAGWFIIWSAESLYHHLLERLQILFVVLKLSC